jgi:hypothetical protein
MSLGYGGRDYNELVDGGRGARDGLIKCMEAL